jgi:hypothetical protein
MGTANTPAAASTDAAGAAPATAAPAAGAKDDNKAVGAGN